VLIIGLAGKAGTGKDTIADYLVRKYGFVKFAFSDALYQEVQDAFGLEDQDLLRNRDTKEVADRSDVARSLHRPKLHRRRDRLHGLRAPDEGPE
jgi:dephospho-CoA kinase